MRRTTILLALAMISSGAAASCERIEYARLKDSSRKVLTDTYCDALLMADVQKNIADVNAKAAADFLALGYFGRSENASRDRTAATKEKQACMRMARDAEDMLLKKFGQKTVRCK